MNEGVKILIDRMESNPEDFEDRDFEPNTGRITRGKFKGVADMLKKRLSGERPAWDAMNVLSTEEIEALTAAYLKMERRKFTNGVMAKLLEEDKLDSYAYVQPLTGTQFVGKGLHTMTGSNGSFVTSTATLQLGAQKLTEEDVKTMSEMIAKWRGEEDGAI